MDKVSSLVLKSLSSGHALFLKIRRKDSEERAENKVTRCPGFAQQGRSQK